MKLKRYVKKEIDPITQEPYLCIRLFKRVYEEFGWKAGDEVEINIKQIPVYNLKGEEIK